MWVADMEFAVAPEIRQAIRDRVDRKNFSAIPWITIRSIIRPWINGAEKGTIGFPKRAALLFAGNCSGAFRLTGHLVREDEKVLIVTPSYGPFRGATKFNHCGLVCSSLKYGGGDFTIDFCRLCRKGCRSAGQAGYLVQSHNPSGRVWSEEKLKQVAAIVEDNDLWIISDEIHCDLLRQGLKHTPMGKVMKDYHASWSPVWPTARLSISPG